MSKFKYSLSISSTEDQYAAIRHKLIDIGYSDINICSKGYLVTEKDGSGGFASYKNPIHIESYQEELFLALAAMREKDDEYGVGEILKYKEKVGRRGFIQIVEAKKEMGDVHFRFYHLKAKYFDGCTYHHFKAYCRKATKEEIFKLFKEKYMTKTINKEEVLHYEVIKAFPSETGIVPLGRIVKEASKLFVSANGFPEFFKPVYTPKEEILKVGTPVKEVKISRDFILAAGEKVDFKKLDLLVKKMQKVGTLGSWKVKGESVTIGCSSFQLNELELVISTYNKFNA